jgi:hypothetical protein
MSNDIVKQNASDMILSELTLSDLKMIAKTFMEKNNSFVKKVCVEMIKKIEWSGEQRLKEREMKDGVSS